VTRSVVLLFRRCILVAELPVICAEIGRRGSQDILPPVVEFKASAHSLMPLHHLRVRFRRESVSRDRLWKSSSVGTLNVPHRNGILQIARMFVRVQEQLDRLPSHKAVGLQCWDGRRLEGIIRGLNTVETPQTLIDE
jgi:hypothetical protein